MNRVVAVEPKFASASVALVGKFAAEVATLEETKREAEKSGNSASKEVEKELEQARAAKDTAENNGVVKFVGDSLGRDGGLYGCAALSNDGFICE